MLYYYLILLIFVIGKGWASVRYAPNLENPPESKRCENRGLANILIEKIKSPIFAPFLKLKDLGNV